jgi:hypothetical protein
MLGDFVTNLSRHRARKAGARNVVHHIAVQYPVQFDEMKPGLTPTKHNFPNFTHICKTYF